MKIGVLGSGNIGRTLVRKLSAAGHEVSVANSRGPETIEPATLAFGGSAVTAAEAVTGVDVLIISIGFGRIPDIAPLIARVPAATVIIDTSNYYPLRDGQIASIDAGQVESVWASEQLGRPIVKAWNAIGTESFANLGQPAGSAGRIAIPVAGDRESDRKVGLALVDETGFDGYDAGPLAQSWRQQPGSPAYCTDLTRAELAKALAVAERARLPQRRELGMAAVLERFGPKGSAPLDGEVVVRLHRALFM